MQELSLQKMKQVGEVHLLAELLMWVGAQGRGWGGVHQPPAPQSLAQSAPGGLGGLGGGDKGQVCPPEAPGAGEARQPLCPGWYPQPAWTRHLLGEATPETLRLMPAMAKVGHGGKGSDHTRAPQTAGGESV